MIGFINTSFATDPSIHKTIHKTMFEFLNSKSCSTTTTDDSGFPHVISSIIKIIDEGTPSLREYSSTCFANILQWAIPSPC